MNSAQLEPIAITGLACRFPNIGGLPELCQYLFTDFNKKIDDCGQTIRENNPLCLESLALSLSKTVAAALNDAGLSNQVSTVRLAIFTGATTREPQTLVPDLRNCLYELLGSKVAAIQFHGSQEFSFNPHYLANECTDGPFLIAALDSKTKSQPEDAADYGISVIVLERIANIPGKKAYAIFSPQNDQTEISYQDIGLFLCPRIEAFLPSSKQRKAVEQVFHGIPQANVNANVQERYLSEQAPWSALSSVPSQVATYGRATELFSLMVASLSLYLKILPACDRSAGSENKKETQRTCFFENPAARPWIHPVSPLVNAVPRRAGVLCPVDGNETNCIFLEALPQEPDLSLIGKWNSEIFAFQAEDTAKLLNQMASFLDFMDRQPLLDLLELSLSLHDGLSAITVPQSGCVRVAILAQSRAELRERVHEALLLVRTEPDKQPDRAGIYYGKLSGLSHRKLAFILPGLGAAYPDMLADLCFYFPEVRQVFDFVENLAIKANHQNLPSRQIFPVKYNNPWGSSNQASLAMMDSAVITVLLAEWAIYKLLQNLGIGPHALMGCSTGEFAVMTMNGSIDILAAAETFYKVSTTVSRSVSPEDLLSLRSLRVNASRATLSPILAELSSPCYLGAEMTPDYALVSGSRSSIEELSKALKVCAIEFYPLPISIPYHTPLVAGMVTEEQKEIAELSIQPPSVESWSCSNESKYPNDVEAIRKLSTDLFEKPILFRSTLEALYDTGVDVFLECGPKGGLTPLVSTVLKTKKHLALAANQFGRPGLEQLLHVLAVLFCQGFAINFEHLYARRRQLAKTSKLDLALSVPFIEAASFVDAASMNDAATLVANYFQSLASLHERLMQSQEKVMLAYLENQESTVASTKVPLAFLPGAEVRQEQERDWLIIQKRLDLAEDLFLLDHAVGAPVSSLQKKVYLLPLMVALEIMSEAADLLINTDKPIIRIKHVRAYKRIHVDQAGFTLEIRANRKPSANSDSVLVELWPCQSDERSSTSPTEPLMSCEIEFAAAYPSSETRSAYPENNERESIFKERQLYGAEGMFHGPRLRSVEKLLSVSEKSNRAQIRHRQAKDWFASNQETPRRFLIDPLLLDNASQLVLYHLFEHDFPVSALLPFYISEIVFFEDPQPKEEAELLHGQVHLLSMTAKGTEADIEISHNDGRIVTRISSISSRAIVLPSAWRDFIHAPAKRRLTVQLNKQSGQEPSNTKCLTLMRIRDLPTDETTIDWCVDYVLSQEERMEWAAFGPRNKRRLEWFMGRLAAKDALRILLKDNFGLDLCPADIEIKRSPSGAPIITGAWTQHIEWVPQIAISHSQGTAVAIATKSGSKLLPGLDIEEIKERDQGFAELAFTKKEQDYLEQLPGSERALWETTLWTAKEAVAKAIGTGLRGNPQRFEMEEINHDSGELFIRVLDQGSEHVPESLDCRFRVSTERIENMALSLTIID